MDVFSSFDSQTRAVWIYSLITIVIVLQRNYWVGNSSVQRFVRFFKRFIWGVVDSRNGKHIRGFAPAITVIFCILLVINLTGIIPYVFSVTRHLVWTLPLAMLTWLALLISGWVWDIKKASASLLPSGSPLYLAPLLVIIEVISLIIRPITLSVRLAANISAGHLIIALIGSYLIQYNSLLFVVAGYFIFEFGICIIQAYVFVLLLALYANDHSLSVYHTFINFCSKGSIAPFLGHEPNSLI